MVALLLTKQKQTVIGFSIDEIHTLHQIFQIFKLCTDSRVLQDFKDRYFIAYCGAWSLGFLTKHNPGLVLDDQLSV